MALSILLPVILLSCITLALSAPVTDNVKNSTATPCFPALDFKAPSHLPKGLDHWWCDPKTEYAFVGFSYEVTACEVSRYRTSPYSHYLPQVKLGLNWIKISTTFDTDLTVAIFVFTVSVTGRTSSMSRGLLHTTHAI